MTLTHGSFWHLRLGGLRRASGLAPDALCEALCFPSCVPLEAVSSLQQAHSGHDGGSKFLTRVEEEDHYFSSVGELLKDASVGLDVLDKINQSDWFTWSGGSTLCFWRWPSGEQQTFARDGMWAWISDKLPQYTRKSPIPNQMLEFFWSPRFQPL